jgi:hypothetical protein
MMTRTRLFPFCFVLFVSASAWATETYFEVLDNEANIVLGTMTALDQTQIIVDVQGKSQTIPLEKVVKIRNLAPSPYEGTPTASGGQPPALTTLKVQSANERRVAEQIQKSNEQAVKKMFPGSVIALELKDGSRLTASSFTIARSHAVCRLLEQQSDLSIPLNNISAARFAVRNLLEVVNPPADWLRLAVPNTEGDRLIVGNPGSFDVYAGILQDISGETISFSVDGEVLPVPRRRVFGLVLHGEPAPPAYTPLATLTLWTGTRGLISDMLLNENELTWQTTTGLTVTVPLDRVSEIDFGEKGVFYLFDFERVRNEFSLPFGRLDGEYGLNGASLGGSLGEIFGSAVGDSGSRCGESADCSGDSRTAIGYTIIGRMPIFLTTHFAEGIQQDHLVILLRKMPPLRRRGMIVLLRKTFHVNKCENSHNSPPSEGCRAAAGWSSPFKTTCPWHCTV